MREGRNPQREKEANAPRSLDFLGAISAGKVCGKSQGGVGWLMLKRRIRQILFMIVLGRMCATAQIIELASPNEESSGQFGLAIAGVPDSNGDGFGEILVGAPGEDPTGSLN